VVLVIGGCSKTGSALIEQAQQRGQRVRAFDDVLVGLCCDYRSSRADGYGASLSGTFECAGKPAGSLDQLVAGVQR
jgi:nucleoside-diphosphate-sugar epimerase